MSAVPQSARVVIAGGGTLLAQGGDPTAGEDGQSGEAPGAVSGCGGAGAGGGGGASAGMSEQWAQPGGFGGCGRGDDSAVDEEGKVMSVKLNVENVYEDLYYFVYWGLSPLPEEMVPVTWECADEDGTIRVEAPADDESGFYQIRVTDHLEWLDW